MIIAAVMTALGVLACVLAVLLLRKKKLSGAWGVSLLACALILSTAGGIGIAQQIQNRTEEYSYIYLALCYLEQGQTDPAALYLKRVSSHTGYHLTAAQALLEQVRGNDTVAQLRLDVLKNIQDGSDAQSGGLTRLQTWRQRDDGLGSVTAALRAQLPLSNRKKLELDQFFAMETGSWIGDAGADTGDMLLLQINQSLRWQDWSGALNAAVQLVEESASTSNRLLLAEVIADVTYSGGSISTHQFERGESADTDTQAREAEELMVRYSQLLDELELFDQKLLLADETERATLADQSAELAEEAETVQRQARNIFALRALNSIADIHSLEAQVVRARLYYAMRNYQEAIDTLRHSAESVRAALSENRPLVNALRLVGQVYETEGEVGVDTPEFREELQILLGSVHPQLIQLGLTPLASDFAERIVSDQKVYGSGLYIVNLDASQYPRIRVRLGGQTEDIESIVNRELVVVSDTRTVVDTYEVEYGTEAERLNSICFVVDTSGSMDGTPIQDAREALGQFLDQVTGNTELALVKFESSADTLVELTTSTGTMKTAIGSLRGGGGTDITAGIVEGTSVLRRANGARTMIMMTDGQSSIDLGAVQEAVDQGITIFTIGFGGAVDEVLQTIADMSGGQYIRADSSTELINVYSSLQGIIGNTVTVTYTVENEEEALRYFFLMNEERNRSVRREYFIEDSAPDRDEPMVTLIGSPVFQTREYLARLTQPDAAFRASYNGTGLDTVTAADAGGYACAIAGQGESSLQLDVPARIPNGVYEICLRTADGSEYRFPDMLAVGNLLDCRNYRAGSLHITANQALQLDNNLLVLGNRVEINELPGGGTVNTLSLQLDGLLMFPSANLPVALVEEDGTLQQIVPDQIDLGGAGTGLGRGVLRIDQNDKAYADYVNPVILENALLLEYDLECSRFTGRKEGVQ